MSLESIPPYASTRLIAYLGNKRALLPFLSGVFREVESELPIRSFLDPFAGSGAVSRLARSRGWAVMAADAEEYSKAVNEAWLGVSADELPLLFANDGGLEAVLAGLNELHPQRGNAEPRCPVEPYIARHYGPESTQAADWRRERLFYTRENAVFLDRARCAIEAMRPARASGDLYCGPYATTENAYATTENPPERAATAERAYRAERSVLLGLLVYEAATHANTSGVFKAYHKGFGGHGRDALGRILSPMSLEPPRLWPGKPSEVRRSGAAEFCARRSADLCYLDPPYNQHQYGSNYHLLNTIARWDRAPVDDARTLDGSLLSAAGIPAEWRKSRSEFCSRLTAGAAFRELLASVDARCILLSYNTEGFVPPEELFELLSDRAEVSLRSIDYVKYRGGRQSVARRSRNREILFVARRSEGRGRPADAAVAGRACSDGITGLEPKEPRTELRNLKAQLRLARALGGPFDPKRFQALCGGGSSLSFCRGSRSIELPSFRGLLLEEGYADACADLGAEEAEALASVLEPLLLADNAAACAAAASLMEEGARETRLQALALGWIRKLAHRGYEPDFRVLTARLRAVADADRDRLTRFAESLGEVESLFAARTAERRRYRDPIRS